MEIIIKVAEVMLWVVGSLMFYGSFLAILGFLTPSKKFKKTEKKYTYCVVVAARNEEKIIAQVLHSIQKQDYPADKITTIVVAHNCTDKTAEIARAEGAIVYEYNNSKERTRGFALKHGFERIKEEYGIYAFDGYVICDADFVMEQNYFTEMNNAFDNKRYDVFVGYLNSKNVDMGLFPSWRGMCFYRVNCTGQRPRSMLGLNTRVNGPAPFIRNFILHDGYKWDSIADDSEIWAWITAKGYRSTYVESAKYYTENPKSLRMIARQEIRWSRANLVVFYRSFLLLLIGFFLPKDLSQRRKQIPEKPKEKLHIKALIGTQKRLSCYDAFLSLLPGWVLHFIMGVIYPLGIIIYGIITGNSIAVPLIQVVITYLLLCYYSLLQNTLTLIREYKNVRCNRRIFLYIFIWPFVDIIFSFVSFIALILPTKWIHYPTQRHDTREIEEIKEIKNIYEVVAMK